MFDVTGLLDAAAGDPRAAAAPVTGSTPTVVTGSVGSAEMTDSPGQVRLEL